MVDTCHFEIQVTSLAAARDFYVDLLGFEILQELPALRLLAVRAGSVRISIFESGDGPGRSAPSAHIIFRTGSLDGTIARLREKGIAISDQQVAPGFMRYVSLHDPAGNYLEIAEYLRDPLAAS